MGFTIDDALTVTGDLNFESLNANNAIIRNLLTANVSVIESVTANVAVMNSLTANGVSVSNTISIRGSTPNIILEQANNTADAQVWKINVEEGSLKIRSYADDETTLIATALDINHDGTINTSRSMYVIDVMNLAGMSSVQWEGLPTDCDFRATVNYNPDTNSYTSFRTSTSTGASPTFATTGYGTLALELYGSTPSYAQGSSFAQTRAYMFNMSADLLGNPVSGFHKRSNWFIR